MHRRVLLLLPQVAMVVAATVVFGVQAHAADVVVQVTGIPTAQGHVGCALFDATMAAAFPMDNTSARQLWPASTGAVATCRFTGVAAGRYAVSVAHDANDNKHLDTNFLGMPTEAWGVSNNARPLLRSPRFEEAAFAVDGQTDAILDVKVAK